VVFVKAWGRLFIARAPEEIEMKEPEKRKLKMPDPAKGETDNP
jgi:hypothetical protein